jgi:DNA-binding CsgD family transcriptional regulator
MRATLIERHRRRVARLLAAGADVAAMPDELVAALDDAIGFDALCSGTLDPASLLPTGVSHVGNVGRRVGIREALAVACGPPERQALRARATARCPVEILGQAPGGDREHSPHYRQVLAPGGLEHSLRTALVADGACFGFLDFLRGPARPDFTADQAEAAAAIVPELARALRQSVIQPGGSDQPLPDQPGVLILDRSLVIVSASPEAGHWLAGLDGGEYCPAVYAVAAAAFTAVEGGRKAPRPQARVRARSGGWLHISGSLLLGPGEPTAAVVVGPARPGQLAPIAARAYGLSAREREVALLAIEGHTSSEIATSLFISPYTVQDHLKAAFGKTGVRSRRDLATALRLQEPCHSTS